MPAMVETMAYRSRTEKDRPWHGLGEAVTHEMTVEEMLKASGLDWKVQRRKLWMRASKESSRMIEIPGQFAITRDKDNSVYAVMSDRYHPIQNAQVMEFFREFTEAGGMHLETAGGLKGGAIVWALASIDDSFTLPGGDKVTGNLLLANSHDGTMVFRGQFTSVRVVCWNTLSAALAEKGGASFAMRHTHKFGKRDEAAAKKALGLAVSELESLHEVAQELAEARVDLKGQEVYRYVAALVDPDLLNQKGPVTLDAVMEEQELEAGASKAMELLRSDVRLRPEQFNRAGKAILDAMLHSPGSQMDSARNTWWGAVNGVTRWVDHDRGRDQDTGLASAWFGQGNKVKQDALALAVDMARAAK